MANIKSSAKRVLVAQRNAARNKAERSALKTSIKKFEAAEQERKAEFNRLNDLVTVAKKNTKEGKYAEACQIYDELKLRLSKESGTLAELMTKTVAEDEENCRRQWCADLLKEAQNKIDEHDYKITRINYIRYG